MELKVQIRRNRSWQLQFNTLGKQKKLLQEKQQELIEETELSSMLKAKIEEAVRRRQEVEKQVWEHVVSSGMKDLLGDPITPETHEICYDMEPKEIDGQHFMFSTQMYIQPKKSEYITGRAEYVPPRLQEL